MKLAVQNCLESQNRASSGLDGYETQWVRLWCGGWDSNPRSPTAAGPKPASFDRSDTPASDKRVSNNFLLNNRDKSLSFS